MRQFAGFGSAFDTNQRFKYLLEHGQTGLSTAFDLPTLMGYDSDHPFSEGEVGKCGVAIASREDMEVLFDGIPLDQVTTSMTINAPASMIFAFFLANAEKQGTAWGNIGGTLQNDILKEYIAQKEWIYPPRPAMRLITDTFKFCAAEMPITISQLADNGMRKSERRSERQFNCGLLPADYDQTHTLNTVVQVRLPWNLMVGARLYYGTGRPYTKLMPPDGSSTVRNNARLPDTVQLDLRIDREWIFRRFAIAVFLEVVNTTYGEAIFGITYPREGNITRFDQPMFNSFNWILPSIGVRGRF